LINAASIKAFLKRPLESYDWMKGEALQALDAALNELKPAPKIDKMWAHQKVCFLLIEALKRFMIHIDMGGGKTFICLAITAYRKQRGESPKAIIFVPYITAVETWVEETKIHAPDLVCVPLLGTTAENLETLKTDGDIFVICYPSAVAMLSVALPVHGKKKKKWQIDPKFVRKTFAGFDMLIMDEIHKAKSVQSLTYRMLRTISAQCDYVIGLTGTPFGRDLMDLWPQFYLIDFGETLGDTLGFFREVFFTKKDKYWGGFEYKFQKKMFGTLKRIIKNKSIRYSVDEFADMPEKKYVVQKIQPHEGIKAYADKALQTIKATIARKDTEKYRAVESEYMRLRQLSSGFMTLKGEDSNKLQIKFDENPKLDALQALVEEMPEGCKMVVFHHFVYTNELISDRLKEIKVKHARVYGKSKDPIAELRRFKADPDCRVLVINSQSGSSSLNLQIANYLVFFEPTDSAIDRQQAISRLYRSGQERVVFIYDLLVNGTVDERISKAVNNGVSLLKSFLDGSEKL
jgi:SNF2 family DNA or RNA helicase